LTIALAKDSKAEKQVAVPIGVAKLKVNGDFVSHGEMITMDLPVYTIEQSQKLNQLNSTDGRPPQAVQVINFFVMMLLLLLLLSCFVLPKATSSSILS
jgi:hypothetical protein